MRTSKSTLCLPALAAALALMAPGSAYAHPGDGGVSDEGVIAPGSEEAKQHPGEGGHLPAKQENVKLVGQAPIDGAGEGRVADVAAFGNTAYLTVRDPEGCSDAGVALMDIQNPSKPRQVGFIDATDGSFPGEGAQVLDVKTASFTGQVLLFNNEICGEGGQGGASLWDVTNPAAPVLLTAHAGDQTAGDEENLDINDIHSVLGWTDGAKAYAVLVDNAETEDVDILDISDPRAPELISETDLNADGVLQKENTPLGGNSFLHDAEVQEINGVMTMVASYWDGGWTLLNVDDPANPTVIDNYDYADKDPQSGLTTNEGNAHQAEFSPDGTLIVGTDEDFSPFRITVSAAGVDYQAAQGSDTPQLDATNTLAGTPVFLGRACAADGVLPPARDAQTVAVIERGLCSFTEKAASVDAAGGYAGVVLINSAADCTGIVTPSVSGELPLVSVSRATGFALFGTAYDAAACPKAPFAQGTAGTPLSAKAVFDGWGYTRLMTTDGLQEIGTYAIPESQDPKYATGFGDLSVHEVAVDPTKDGLAYLSHYTGGLRVVEYGPTGIKEVGAFIAEGGNNFWGVEVHQLPAGKSAGKGKSAAQPEGRQLVLASDRDTGLWIFDYTGGK